MSEIERIISDAPREKIRDMLETYAVNVSRDTVPRYFTEKELEERKQELTENMVKISESAIVLSRAKAIYKEATKPLIETNGKLVTELREGFQEVESNVYEIDDQDAGIMLFYDEQGNFLRKRPLKPNERQGKLFNLKAASDGR